MGSDRRRSGRHATDERDAGVVIVIVAAAMGAILVMVALVLDLSGARRDRDADQTAADAMALAASSELGSGNLSAQRACEAAWSLLVVNLPSAETAPAPACGTLASVCVPATARQVVATVRSYRITLTHPVPDGHALLAGQAPGVNDGTPCDRFGVRIEQDRENLWAAGDVELDVRSVGRYVRGVGDVVAPLVLLSERACGVLTITGNGLLDVLDPGWVVIDSNGQECANPEKVVLDVGIDADGVGTVRAHGIGMWALQGPFAANAYQAGLLTPLPTAAPAPVGDTAIEWRYNCLLSAGCPTGKPAHISQMNAAWGGTGMPTEWAQAPAGFTAWAPTRSCSLSETTYVPAGNWYINCGTTGLSTSGTLSFQGGNIVSDGPIKSTGGGRVRVNCVPQGADPSVCMSDPPSPSILYQRSGDVLASGSMELRETMAHVATATMDMAGSTSILWTAPDDPSHPFDDLMVWATQATSLKITGGANITLKGIIYVPNATVDLSGGASGATLGAQIFADKAKLSGNSTLILQPDLDKVQMVGKGRPLLVR